MGVEAQRGLGNQSGSFPVTWLGRRRESFRGIRGRRDTARETAPGRSTWIETGRRPGPLASTAPPPKGVRDLRRDLGELLAGISRRLLKGWLQATVLTS